MKGNKKSNNDKFDYKGYVSNLGKTGTFYKDKKDSKGVEGQLVSIAEKGVYAMVKNIPFPQLFARADFGKSVELTIDGRKYNCTPVKGSDRKNHGKGKHSGKKNHFSISEEYGQLNNSSEAKALYAFTNWYDKNEPDTRDDDDCDQVVEKFKKVLKAFS